MMSEYWRDYYTNRSVKEGIEKVNAARDALIQQVGFYADKVDHYKEQVGRYEAQVGRYEEQVGRKGDVKALMRQLESCTIPLPNIFDTHKFPPTLWYSVDFCKEAVLQQELSKCKAALEPFANLITPDLIEALPSTTRFSPKLTLAPFIAAHEALYGPTKESP